MRWFVPLLILTSAAISVPAHPQLIPGGPSGDFRVNDRPGTAPTVGPPGGPSLPPDPMMFRDTFGYKPADEILKNIDKDLGRSKLEQSSTSIQSPDLGKDLRSPSDKFR
jgi:hypothetical protein